MPKPGSKIPIQLQLADGATNQFPSAVVKNSLGVALAGSPFALTHSASGLYLPASYPAMPVDDFVSVQYFVYSDAGRTILNPAYEISQVSFELDANDAAILGALGASSEALVGYVDSSRLLGEVDDC